MVQEECWTAHPEEIDARYQSRPMTSLGCYPIMIFFLSFPTRNLSLGQTSNRNFIPRWPFYSISIRQIIIEQVKKTRSNVYVSLGIKVFEIEQLHAIALLSLIFDRQREIHSGSYVNLATYKPQTPYMNSYWLRAFINYYSRMHTFSRQDDFHRSWGSKAKKLETNPWNGISVEERKQRIMIDLKAIVK